MNRTGKTVSLGLLLMGLYALAGLKLAHATPFFMTPGTPPALQDNRSVPVIKIRNSLRRVREKLESRGFSQIDFIDKKVFSYILKACKNGNRLRLKVSKFGRIKRRRVIGSCHSTSARDDRENDNSLRPRQVRRILRARGFNSIRFTDRELPVYRATACKYNRKIELEINRRGRITDRNRIGRCDDDRFASEGRKRPSLSEIRDLLQNRGYYRIRYEDRRLPRYVASACRRGAEFRLVINRWGEVRRRNRTGWCAVRRASEPRTRAPRIEYDDSELTGTSRLAANECQNHLEYVIDRKKIYFDIGRSDIRPDSYRLLRKLAHVMKRCPSAKIEIAGHTDSVGSTESNHDLSHRRANSVSRELVDMGIRRGRLNSKGYGEHHPVASNVTNQGKARNRRIDFIVSWAEEDDNYADMR